MSHPFDPDWTLAPAAMLREWMKHNDIPNLTALAHRCGRGEADLKAILIIKSVLDRDPLTEAHAEMLERGTGIPAALWVGYEQNYRADLAAGRTDTTPED